MVQSSIGPDFAVGLEQAAPRREVE